MKTAVPLLAACLLSPLWAADQNSLDVSIPEPAPAEAALPGSTPPGVSEATAVTNDLSPAEPLVAVTNAPPLAPQTPASPDTVYTVQFGAFNARERAFALYWELSKKIALLQVKAPAKKGEMYRVVQGSYPNRNEAHAAAEKFKKQGITSCFVATIESPKE